MGLLCSVCVSCYAGVELGKTGLDLDFWGYSCYLQSYYQSSFNTGNVVFRQLSYHWIGNSIYFYPKVYYSLDNLQTVQVVLLRYC